MTPELLAFITFVSLSLFTIGGVAVIRHRGGSLRARLRGLVETPQQQDEMIVTIDDRPRHPIEKLLVLLGKKQMKAQKDEWARRPQQKLDMRQQLIQAGIRRPNALALLTGVRMTAAGTVLLFGLLSGALVSPVLVPAGIAFALTAYMLPGFVVARMAANRRAEIKRRLPDAIDLLLLCVEAGLGLNAALAKVAEERTQNGADPIGEELLLLSKELQVGLARRDALRNLADRTGADEIRSLAAQLIQSERLGSSIGAALRAQSQSIRTQRRLQAEELANKTQIKLLFPLIMFIFPSVLIVILMPAVLRLVEALQTLM